LHWRARWGKTIIKRSKMMVQFAVMPIDAKKLINCSTALSLFIVEIPFALFYKSLSLAPLVFFVPKSTIMVALPSIQRNEIKSVSSLSQIQQKRSPIIK
jgi:hypothetical protein